MHEALCRTGTILDSVHAERRAADHSADMWSRPSGYCRCPVETGCSSGSAELEDEGTIEIELSFNNGADAILKARRE